MRRLRQARHGVLGNGDEALSLSLLGVDVSDPPHYFAVVTYVPHASEGVYMDGLALAWSDAFQCEVDAMSPHLGDLPLDPAPRGLALFVGRIRVYGPDMEGDYDAACEGAWRKLEPAEVAALGDGSIVDLLNRMVER